MASFFCMNGTMAEKGRPQATPEPEQIVFYASLAPIQSAITLHGSGDGARLKRDVPATDTGAVLLLQHYGADRLLRVTIEVID